MIYTPEQIAEVLGDARRLFALDSNVEQEARHAAAVMSHMAAIIEQQRAELYSEKLNNMNYINERDAAEEKWEDALAKIARMEELHSAEVEQQRAEIKHYRENWEHVEKVLARREETIEQQRERITALEASLKSIGEQAEECGDPANPAFFDLVSLIVDEIDKHKEPPHA